MNTSLTLDCCEDDFAEDSIDTSLTLDLFEDDSFAGESSTDVFASISGLDASLLRRDFCVSNCVYNIEKYSKN